MDARSDNYKQSDHNGGRNTVLCHDIGMIAGSGNLTTKNAIISTPFQSQSNNYLKNVFFLFFLNFFLTLDSVTRFWIIIYYKHSQGIFFLASK